MKRRDFLKTSATLPFVSPLMISNVVGEPNKKSTYPEINNKFTDGFKKIVFDLDPGDCVIFNPFILHKSLKNSSKMTRFNIGIDIQDFHVNGDKKIINKMIKIKNERSRRRSLFANR